jgi:hypothetical protein
MRRFLVLLAPLLVLAAPALGQTATPVSELTGEGGRYDGLEVTVEGELVGDVGERQDGTVWSQLNDDSYARSPIRETGTHGEGNTGIGVRIDGSLGHDFTHVGGYRWRGPIVRATGVWHFHDAARGGESYLEVTALEVLEQPRLLGEDLNWPEWVIGGVLVGVVGVLYWRSNREAGGER